MDMNMKNENKQADTEKNNTAKNQKNKEPHIIIEFLGHCVSGKIIMIGGYFYTKVRDKSLPTILLHLFFVFLFYLVTFLLGKLRPDWLKEPWLKDPSISSPLARN